MSIFLLKALYFFPPARFISGVTHLREVLYLSTIVFLLLLTHWSSKCTRKNSPLLAIPLSNYFVYCTVVLMKTLYLYGFFIIAVGSPHSGCTNLAWL